MEFVVREMEMWRYVGRSGDLHTWEGWCAYCGEPATVQADDAGAPQVQRELDEFDELECPACRADRLHELDHILRAMPEAQLARVARDAPLPATVPGGEHEQAYRDWCSGRGLTPLPARSAGPT